MDRARFLCLAVAALTLLGTVVVLAPPVEAQSGFTPGPQPYGRGFGKNKIQYREFEWRIYHSPHFDVYYYTDNAELLQRVVSMAESAYDRLSRQLDFKIQEPTPLIFYETHAAFEQNNIILNFIPEGVGAFASPVRFRMVLPTDLPEAELMDLITHELTHIFQYHILFQGSVTRSLTSSPPIWFMEGMASFMAEDETARDKMFLRDAVVNDRIPPVSQWSGAGFFAYRIGHSVFEFIVERWGWEGFVDFIYEYRNTIGGSIARAIERTYRMDPQEFDDEFRLWLRKQYLAELLETGEPGEFGRPFRGPRGRPAQEVSPVPSPSGDLVAVFSQTTGDTDIVLYDTENRRFLRNLTSGFTNAYQYLVAQEMTLGRQMGRDLAFSPDGNVIAAFGRREGGRSLLFFDVLQGGMIGRIDMPTVDQQFSPAWSPDGRTVAFSGWQNGQFDIFEVDLETEQITNLTNDPIYDGAPVYSPDGQSIVFSSVVGDGYTKLFRIERDDPSQRVQMTFGETNETDAVFSTVADRLYYTSDEGGVLNIYSLDLDTGQIKQYTNSVVGSYNPAVLPEPDGERLIYVSLWKGRFGMYVTDVEESVTEPMQAEKLPEATIAEDIPPFEPDIQVAINDDDKEKYGGFKLFLENADTVIGVDDNQTLLGEVILTFSDYLGDRRIVGLFGSVDRFSNFDAAYFNLSKRRQWSLRLFDARTFFLQQDPDSFFTDFERGQNVFRQTGFIASLIYPVSYYVRGEIGAGYIFRKLDFQSFLFDPETGVPIPVIQPIDDDFPVIQGALIGDSTIFAPWGPVSGRRWRIDAFYAADTSGGGGGAVTQSIDVDYRQYVPLSRRTNLAFRIFGGKSDGDTPSPFIFGGLDDLRGFEFRSIAGTDVFFTNLELRFPLIDVLATPFIGFRGIRGVVFLDIGGAWFSEFQSFEFFNSDEERLEDAIAAFGYGISFRFFGLQLNWDFAKRWNFENTLDEGYRTSFWIGSRF